MKKLTKEFLLKDVAILNSVRKIKAKKFTLGELFSASTGDVDLQKKDLNGNGQFLINSGVDNQGIKGKTDKTAKIFPANTITIDFWGNAYYRDFEYKMATHNHVFSLSGDVIKNKYVGIYIVGLLSKFPKLFSYDNMATWNKLKELEIELPVTDYGDKDYDYMERYIRTMEKVVIKDLDAYLKASGLNDYELTDEDKEALSLSTKSTHDKTDALADNFENRKIKFKNFPITDLFYIKNTKCVTQDKIIPNSGTIRYLTASNINNAISTHITCGQCLVDDGNCIFIGGKTMAITYQDKEFVSNDSHNLALYLKDETKRTSGIQRYIVAAIKKSISHKYYWSDSISWKKIQSDIVSLPVKANDQIDFDYMERYIRAVEKVVIRDVVKFKDKWIETTKKAVASE